MRCPLRPRRPAKPRSQPFHARKARDFQAISTRHYKRLELAAAALFLFDSLAVSGALARRFISSRSQASACATMVDRSSKRGCLRLLCRIDDDGFDRVTVAALAGMGDESGCFISQLIATGRDLNRNRQARSQLGKLGIYRRRLALFGRRKGCF
jgi:hypothetical protein